MGKVTKKVLDDEYIDEYLMRLAENKQKQAWVGTRPPFEMTPIDLLNSTNCRVSSKLHHQYTVVWFMEHMMCDIHPLSWKIALDEAICLLRREGKLIIRTKQNDHFTIPKLKNFLGRKIDISCEIDLEYKFKDDTWILVFNITRNNYESYLSDSWTFAVLTNGKKEKNVLHFLESIKLAHEAYEKRNDIEIIICGPQNEKFDRYDVRYIDLGEFRDDCYAEISRKKNVIAKEAKNDNLLIAHDRYVLPQNFFIGFEKYGYDFGYVTVRQSYTNGDEYPAFCRMDNYLLWGNPVRVDNYNYLFPSAFLNGGLLIFKTYLLRNIGFNKLLMWNQMEDVELTKSFQEHSIIPRVNFFVEAVTIGVNTDYTGTFKLEDTGSLVSAWGHDNTPYSIRPKFADSKIVKKLQYIAIFFPKRLKSNKVYRKMVDFILSK